MTFPRSHVWVVAQSGSGPGQLGFRIRILNLCPLWPGFSLHQDHGATRQGIWTLCSFLEIPSCPLLDTAYKHASL